MPKELERKLMAEAAEKGYTGRRKDAYVYGTMSKRGLLKKKRTGHEAAAALGNRRK